MEILIVLPEDSLGGAEQYLKMIATHYKNENVSIYYFLDSNSKKWDDIKKESHQYYMTSKHEIWGLLKFVFSTFSNKKKYDYIFTSHVYTNGLVGMLLSVGLLKTKYFVARESTSIFLRYSGFKLLTYKFAYFLGYRRINLLICQTNMMKEQLLKHFPSIIKRTKVDVIANPIDISSLKSKAKQPLPSYIPENFIVSAGRLIEEKGYDILIKAFSEIKKDDPTLKLIILGNGNQQEALEQLIHSLKLKDDVILMGFVDNVYNYFNHAKLCVVSSRIEGFPNVLLQMMSQNDKVVSTLCAGGIEDIKGVYTCAPNDSKELYNAMTRCLNDSTENNIDYFADYLKPRQLENFMQIVNDLVK